MGVLQTFYDRRHVGVVRQWVKINDNTLLGSDGKNLRSCMNRRRFSHCCRFGEEDERESVWEYFCFGNYGGSKEVKGGVDGFL